MNSATRSAASGSAWVEAAWSSSTAIRSVPSRQGTVSPLPTRVARGSAAVAGARRAAGSGASLTPSPYVAPPGRPAAGSRPIRSDAGTTIHPWTPSPTPTPAGHRSPSSPRSPTSTPSTPASTRSSGRWPGSTPAPTAGARRVAPSSMTPPSPPIPPPSGATRADRRRLGPAPTSTPGRAWPTGSGPGGPPGGAPSGHRLTAGRRPEVPDASYFLVSQKILSISAIWANSSSATARSVVFLTSPAFLVAFQNRSWRLGYFSRCSGLK